MRRGDVAVVRFPFSDLSGAKQRPAVVLADVGRGDYLMVQVTSRNFGDPRAIELLMSDFSMGGLLLTSFARPGKLFTANQTVIAKTVGRLNRTRFDVIVDAVVDLLRYP